MDSAAERMKVTLREGAQMSRSPGEKRASTTLDLLRVPVLKLVLESFNEITHHTREIIQLPL